MKTIAWIPLRHVLPCLMLATLLMWMGAPASAAPNLPNIPAYSTNVTQAPYNAAGDGVTVNTTAIQNAINDVSAKGGGTVEIPGPGVYLSGPLTMKSKINLQIDSGAILRMLPKASWPGTSPLLSLASLNNVEISGSGAIDGQGSDWWANNSGSGLYMIYFTSCNTVLIQSVTVSNAPKQQIVFKSSKGGNITIQGITIKAPSSHASVPSHNTDGIDLVGTNCLIQNCTISTGDDNIALGTSSSGVPAADILITNCVFGDGHGMTIGSNTQGGVSNLMVINCTFNGTDTGIRMKSDNATSGGGGQGGIAQNLYYYNLGMTNIRYQPILIYSYYNEDSSPTGIDPATAAGEPIGTSLYPIWRNIVISNLTATVASGGEAGMIWGRTEAPASNIILDKINITAPANFKLYNLNGLQIVDSQITLTGGSNTFSIYNARFTITNSVPGAKVFSMDGLAGTNSLALYNARAAMNDPAAIGINPLTLSASTLSNSTSLALPAASVANFVLGTNSATVAVAGNLSVGGTINASAGGGFTSGVYTLFAYSGVLTGPLPALGTTPGGGYSYAFDTSTAGRFNLVVSSPAPPAPSNLAATGTNLLILLNWDAVPGANTYNLYRGTSNGGPYPTVFSGLVSTNYSDANVTNGVTYYYVVTSVVSGNESTNSIQASAAPLPSNQPADLQVQESGGGLQLSWPQDHLGWSLEIQTNSLSNGLGTNWTIVPNSSQTNQIFLPVDPANGSVFLRLSYQQ
jgi:polygalacturonase